MVINLKVLVRYGELMLKGKNRKNFINKVNRHIRNKFRNFDLELNFLYDHLTIEASSELKEVVINNLKEIPGLHSYSIIYEASHDIEDIVSVSKNALIEELETKKTYSFKIESKRTYKHFPMTSPELTKLVAPMILKDSLVNLKVEVRDPDVILNIDIKSDKTIIYLNKELLMGGFPAGIAGKGLLMMSGGIDSPVAGYKVIKQGVDLELIHFESSPLTPLESINKVSDLASKLAKFMVNGRIKLHIVPFYKIHEALLNNVEDSYLITIMRRMMYRISERFANSHKIPVLINGESLGQVASQTLLSMKAVENVTNIPILRPLITDDKINIIAIAKRLDTYNISIRPFNDCCSIYVPKAPVISPKIKICEKEEAKYNYEPLIEKALEDIKTISIDSNFNIDFSLYGFTFEAAYNEWKGSHD